MKQLHWITLALLVSFTANAELHWDTGYPAFDPLTGAAHAPFSHPLTGAEFGMCMQACNSMLSFNPQGYSACTANCMQLQGGMGGLGGMGMGMYPQIGDMMNCSLLGGTHFSQMPCGNNQNFRDLGQMNNGMFCCIQVAGQSGGSNRNVTNVGTGTSSSSQCRNPSGLSTCQSQCSGQECTLACVQQNC